MTTLADERIVVRSPTPDDARAVADAVHDSLERLAPWMPWATENYDVDLVREWIANENHGFVICDVDADEIVGGCGLNRHDTLNRSANLGYWIRTGWTGRGLASRAATLVVRHGFDELELNRIEIVMSVENDASRRVAERIGAQPEGVRRSGLLLDGRTHDAFVYSLIAADESIIVRRPRTDA